MIKMENNGEIKKEIAWKQMLCIEEVSMQLGVDIETVKDLINCGDLKAVGSKKDLIMANELKRFIYGDINYTENEKRAIDIIGNQQYHPNHSIVIEDLSNEEWEEMKRNGNRELTPYWNESRQKWCIALSLGYDENKKRIRKVITANKQEEVWEKYKEFKARNTVLKAETNEEFEGKKKHPKAEMLLKDYLEDYLNRKKGTVSQRTHEGKLKLSKHIINDLGHYKMENIDRKVLENFIDNLPEKTYTKGGEVYNFTKSTINKIYDILHCVIKDAVSDECILKNNIMTDVKRPKSKASKKKKEKTLSVTAIKNIIKSVEKNQMIHTWIQLLLYTGARPSEILALKFSDIDYLNKTISISEALTEVKNDDCIKYGTNGKMRAIISNLKNDDGNDYTYQCRTLKVSDRVLKLLKEWEKDVTGNAKLMEMKKSYGTQEYLFSGSKGQFWCYHYYRQAYDRLLKREGIDNINPYRFRHTFCTNALRRGINIKTVQLMLGDNTTEMVLKVYANMNQDDIDEGCMEVIGVVDKMLEDDKILED